MRRALALLVVLAGCGDEGGVLVEIHQSERLAADVDTLHLFVGTPDQALGGFAGVGRPDDVIALDAKLADRPHSILIRGGRGAAEVPARVAVVGKSGDLPVGLAVLDVSGVPGDVVLRYELVLEPADALITTESGCLLAPDGAVVSASGDRDCDGVGPEAGDCDDLDPQVHPGAYDACAGAGLGVDEDCDDAIDDGDLDGDGADCLRDCDDADPERTPGKLEDCEDGVDSDCDLAIDEGVPEICDDQIDNDCDPETPDQAGVEICGDGADNDCDDAIDEGRDGDADVDGDQFDCAVDCDDDDPFVHPGAEERCNNLDDDCDAAHDEAVNEDGDPALCLDDCDDLDDTRFPDNNEICDFVDNDCVEATRPAPLPCLELTADPCVYGFRACDEAAGSYSEICAGGAAEPGQPLELCQQFLSCAASDEGLACEGEPTHGCRLLVGRETHDVCAGAQRVFTAAGDPASCTWVLLGGTTQQGWSVGLTGDDVPSPSPTVAACTATFSVQAVPDGLQPGQFVLALFVDGAYDHGEVIEILPVPSNVCALPSLTCGGGG